MVWKLWQPTQFNQNNNLATCGLTEWGSLLQSNSGRVQHMLLLAVRALVLLGFTGEHHGLEHLEAHNKSRT